MKNEKRSMNHVKAINAEKLIREAEKLAGIKLNPVDLDLCSYISKQIAILELANDRGYLDPMIYKLHYDNYTSIMATIVAINYELETRGIEISSMILMPENNN